ncbi:glycosyltransferase family 2 protein [Auriscalpium vulgare]|uniref:Glycosyltransferase family 2 protein n=1 Tax=Auriscalpium vulgare TaxID=40419 RepID=A0ACB8RZH3_9AGAM|nr:glycosyltransferase family 2 protein [Auriscalpium vulgare]
MAYNGGGQRPPRAARPSFSQSAQNPLPPMPSSPPSYADPVSPYAAYTRPPPQPYDGGRGSGGVSFQAVERGDRSAPLDQRQRQHSAYQSVQPSSPDPESGFAADPSLMARKKSLVRPDREKIEPGHRQWHYRTHAAQFEGADANLVQPSTTGNAPMRDTLRRGRSLLGREQDVHESGLALFKRGATLRRKRLAAPEPEPQRRKGCFSNIPGPHDAWVMYCYLLTACVPSFLLRSCGIRSPEQQRAWREKMGLLSIIAQLMASVGFLTFGFTEVVCGKPPNRFHSGFIDTGSVIIHGYDYDFSHFNHPAVGNFDGHSNPLFEGNWNVAGNDASFLFQNTNGNCQGIITKASNSSITGNNGHLDWYFPCNVYNQHGTSAVNLTGYEASTSCHLTTTARNQLSQLHPQGQVYLSWDDVRNQSRNLAVFESYVLDLNLLKWLNKGEVNYPRIFDEMMTPNGTFNGKDISMYMMRTGQRKLGHCLEGIIGVGFIDTNTIGCVASDVVLYVSLVFIIGVVAIRFVMAVMFAWFFGPRIGAFKHETYEQRMQRMSEIENWTNDIYRPAPSDYRPNVAKNGLTPNKKDKKSHFLPRQSRFTPSENVLKGPGGRPVTAYGTVDTVPYKKGSAMSVYGAQSLSGKSKMTDGPYRDSRSSTSLAGGFVDNPCPFPLQNVVPQPPSDYEPFNFRLAHTICLVTAYSESFEGLRTTLDSLATTDYPNSHKLILVIADGMVKGAGNDKTTPEICLTMMKDFVIEPEDVEAHSYVAIADGHKRHNMAKVYAGFYDYDDATVEISKQQRVPMVLVAKTGNPLEANDPKPGNRGKRDSQIVLMSFLQKVMFDERMTTFEYEFFNSVWRVTGISPDRYELVLCVDADTKVFPDSLTRMSSCMIEDEEIMGLCGETKIANKGETWVTMIQVFEYYISHHMTKAFESMFGGVTCLPGCFSMYRIKAPKGASGYWVPILANPDIVEHYSENVVDTLHKKNLLLLGEDRYLTTLMLKTFPKRKNVFCPSAVCKTVVPDTFGILLSQRRRWINSTVHNLAELILVRDLCGTFCFSMQFVVGMELAGTLVLPAAISFTLYLVISAIIPGGPNTTIPLVLLAIVLGLPGLLIVITTRKVAYVGWMLVYLLSLPIWNGLLPAYAFWHFDDFSWGQTRIVAGDKAGAGDHGDKDGEFDSTNIVMKRWAEFERERRWKSGTQSRDSAFYDPKGSSPKRYSTVSNTDTGMTPASQGFDSSTADSYAFNNVNNRPRYDSNQLLTLPAPLALNRPSATNAAGSSSSVARSSEDVYSDGSSGHQRLISSPASANDFYPEDAYTSPASPAPRYGASPSQVPFESHVTRTAGGSSAVLRQATVSNQYPVETPNYHAPQAGYSAYTAEPDEYVSPALSNATSYSSGSPGQHPRGGRGVSLSDNGPVPGPDGVRRVARPSGRRPSSQTPQQNRYSRTGSLYANLPPGAAPPAPGGFK